MRFIYKAKKGPEEIVVGMIEGASQDEAVARVRQVGLVPISIEPAKEKIQKEKKTQAKKKTIVFRGRRVSKNHIYLFTKKLKVLLRSQEPILKSLYFLEDQATNQAFKEVIRSIAESVKEGLSFSESLAKFPQYFPALYVSIIKAGEASGKLDYSLDQITRYMASEKKLSQKVISSLAYPVVLVSVGLGTIIFIITFVIPKLSGLFEDFGDSLPIVTKILLGISGFFSKYWIVLLALTALLAIFLASTRRLPWQKKLFSFVKKRTPVVKDIIYNQSLSRLAGALAILLSSGISLLNSLRIVIPLAGDDSSQKELRKACEQIETGDTLEESLTGNCPFLPEMFIKMVAVGEASGKLDEILKELSDNYADEVDTMTKVVTSLIEPMAILIVGGILGFIIVAVLLPIFEMSMLVK